MRRVIIREYDQLAEALSNLNAMFAFRIMNLCVKAEEASLLPVKVMVEGEMQNLEKCASINKKDDFTFVIIPQFDEDIQMISMGIAHVHPEFKQSIDSTKVDILQPNGSTKKVDARYIVVTMPDVDDDRYDLLKDGVKLAYEDCKTRMEVANARADAQFAELLAGEEKENIEIVKQERENLNEQWYGQRDKLYNEKLKEIEDGEKRSAHIILPNQEEKRFSLFDQVRNIVDGGYFEGKYAEEMRDIANKSRLEFNTDKKTILMRTSLGSEKRTLDGILTGSNNYTSNTYNGGSNVQLHRVGACRRQLLQRPCWQR